MTRNVYLGADLIPLAAAPDQAAFEQAAAQRFQTVQTNAFPTRAKALAAEIRKAKPDIVGVQEATIWRRGADGVKDGPATPGHAGHLRLEPGAAEGAQGGGSPYKEVVGRDWFDFEAPTALGYDVRVTQRDVILVRKGSKVKVRKTFSGQFTNHFDPPTPVGVARQLRGWVGVDGTLAKKKFRFVSTHLEAYSPAIADQQMQQLLKRAARSASKKRQSILVGDYNSAPGANANDRGTTRTTTPTTRRSRPASATTSRGARRAASPRTCTAPRTSSRRGSTTCSCAPKDQGAQVRDRRHQAGRRPLPVRPRGHHRHAAPEVRIVAGRWGGRRLTTPKGARHAPDRRTACARRCSRSWAIACRTRACSTCSRGRARSGSRRSRAAPRRRRSSTPRRPRWRP